MSMKINAARKKELIVRAQCLYTQMYSIRCMDSEEAKDIDIATFRGACYEMSCLVHFLAEELYHIPEEDNKIYECEFRYEGACENHFYNRICGEIVDATIMQFNNYSPYDNHEECYTENVEWEYSDVPIKREIEYWKKTFNRVRWWISKLVS